MSVLIRAPILFMRALLLSPNYLPKAPFPNTITRRIRASPHEFLGQTAIQSLVAFEATLFSAWNTVPLLSQVMSVQILLPPRSLPWRYSLRLSLMWVRCPASAQCVTICRVPLWVLILVVTEFYVTSHWIMSSVRIGSLISSHQILAQCPAHSMSSLTI